MSEQINYRTRIEVQYQDGTQLKTITPIESLSFDIDSPHDVIDSTEKTNVGFIRRPIRVTFTLNVLAAGDAALSLAMLQLKRKSFNIMANSKEPEGAPSGYDVTTDDWAFNETGITLTNCVITSSTPTTATADGVARSTFRGSALIANIGGIDYPIE